MLNSNLKNENIEDKNIINKNIQNENLTSNNCTYYISGHSGRDTYQINGMFIEQRINVPKNMCIFTLVRIDSTLSENVFFMFNEGLLNDNLSNELTKLSFEEKTNNEIETELKILEKNIYVNGLFNIYNQEKDFKKILPYFNGIFSDIIKNNKNENITVDNILNFMNMPVINIVKNICHNLLDIKKNFYVYNEKEISKEISNYVGSNINSLEKPINYYLSKTKSKLLNENYTYYDFFKDFTDIELRRYTDNNKIYNYPVYVEDDNDMYGVFKAPVKIINQIITL